jgi:hypothetical protein
VAENDVPGLGDVFVELQPEAGAAQQRGKLALADLDRLAPQVLPARMLLWSNTGRKSGRAPFLGQVANCKRCGWQ